MRAMWKAIGRFFDDYRRYSYHLLIFLCVITTAYGVVLVYSANDFNGGGLRGWIIQPLAGVVGLIAALIGNLAFLRATLGFLMGCIFYAASIVCQAIFLNNAFRGISDPAPRNEHSLHPF